MASNSPIADAQILATTLIVTSTVGNGMEDAELSEFAFACALAEPIALRWADHRGHPALACVESCRCRGPKPWPRRSLAARLLGAVVVWEYPFGQTVYDRRVPAELAVGQHSRALAPFVRPIRDRSIAAAFEHNGSS